MPEPHVIVHDPHSDHSCQPTVVVSCVVVAKVDAVVVSTLVVGGARVVVSASVVFSASVVAAALKKIENMVMFCFSCGTKSNLTSE